MGTQTFLNPDSVNLWLDDNRDPPSIGWAWAKSVDEAIQILKAHETECASLDYDLSQRNDAGLSAGGDQETGLDLIWWMALWEIWPTREITVHSGDPEGRELMVSAIETEGPFIRKGSRRLVRAERELAPADEEFPS